MSWKSIEMQVALPRTQDAGKLQDLLQQQGRVTQEQLAQTLTAEELRKRQTVQEQQASGKLKNDEKEDKSLSHLSKSMEKSPEELTEKEVIQHPYLGKKIDFSG
ncbi:hypothetical protein F9U64_03860 [Gracilibacillus oryzae]|uniref:Uncharacterized protein n=1 Tax=Gracilibacillus oryzae TaxID=1672701 RepID=A0A7C8GV11_9BACI|nr:hypothetical protein [Gracilibacillus oryzae]KAB8138763.1 hypothetical protein F9U64_03860 [Gracilibacillus oryzae]